MQQLRIWFTMLGAVRSMLDDKKKKNLLLKKATAH